MRSSVVRELLKLTTQPDVISFTAGLPGADQYSTTEGERPLREIIARHTCRYGIEVNTENVLITSGSQQALDLIGKIVLNPGDHVPGKHSRPAAPEIRGAVDPGRY